MLRSPTFSLSRGSRFSASALWVRSPEKLSQIREDASFALSSELFFYLGEYMPTCPVITSGAPNLTTVKKRLSLALNLVRPYRDVGTSRRRVTRAATTT